MITVSSIFRNAHLYMDDYFAQVATLRKIVEVRLVIGEGDSGDDTGNMLRRRVRSGDTVVTVNHGGPLYGSVDNDHRWRQIAQVVRGVTAEVGDPGAAFVWVEGDLLWQATDIMKLVEARKPVAPMVYASDNPPTVPGPRFYDSFGFRQNGKMFAMWPPYFPDGRTEERYQKIDSCGSCFCVPGKDFPTLVAKWDGIWPFTAQGELWVDTEAKVRHR